MQVKIDLLKFQPKLGLRKQADQTFIHDPIRRKYLVQTPEEVVRQLFLWYLLEEKGFPKNRIRTEKTFLVNGLTKRCDILVYDWQMKPYLIVECKSPNIPVSDNTFRQIAAYNLPFQVKYLVLTNGLTNWCCAMDYENALWAFIEDIPIFPAQPSP